MPVEFELTVKYCENCGKELKLRNTRDILRKRFCSRVCFARSGIMGKPWDNPDIVSRMKKNMRKSHTLTPTLLQAHHIVERGLSKKAYYELFYGVTSCIYCHAKRHIHLAPFILSSAHLRGLKEPEWLR